MNKAMAQAMTKEQFIKNHSAYFQQLGFDYQFAGCMYYLLGLALDDKLVYERDDDFVIYREDNGETIKEYYQVKHTSAAGSKMTDADGDFWKTIDNWCSLYELSEPEEKKTFFTKGRFVIITNKKPANFLYAKIEKLRRGSIEIDDILHEIDDRLTQKVSYATSLQTMKNLGRTTLNEFLHEVEIRYMEDFVMDMYQHFLNLFQGPSKADQIVRLLIGELFEYKLECNSNFEFTGSTFKQKYKHLFELVTDENLTLDGFGAEEHDFSQPYEEMPMVQQLQSIEVLSTPVNMEEDNFNIHIPQYRRFMSAYLSYQRTLVLTDLLEKKLNDSALGEWQRVFGKETIKLQNKDRRGDEITDDEKIDAGQQVFFGMMGTNIPISGYKTDRAFSNGWYLHMSNLRTVAWHYDWYKKYIRKS